MRTRARFNSPEILHCTFFALEKIALLSTLKEVKPSLDRKVIKFLTFDNSFPPLLAKTRSGLTTATKFSRQNDAGSHTRTIS